MNTFLKVSLFFSLLTLSLSANTENNQSGALNFSKEKSQREKLNFSMVISGGVSLGAYEAGYNWAMIKMLSRIVNL